MKKLIPLMRMPKSFYKASVIYSILAFLLIVNFIFLANVSERMNIIENFFRQAQLAGYDYISQESRFQDTTYNTMGVLENAVGDLFTEVQALKKKTNLLEKQIPKGK